MLSGKERGKPHVLDWLEKFDLFRFRRLARDKLTRWYCVRVVAPLRAAGNSHPPMPAAGGRVRATSPEQAIVAFQPHLKSLVK